MEDARGSYGSGEATGARPGRPTESAAWFGLSFAAAWALLAAFAIAVKPSPAEPASADREVLPAEATAAHPGLPANELGSEQGGTEPWRHDAG